MDNKKLIVDTKGIKKANAINEQIGNFVKQSDENRKAAEEQNILMENERAISGARFSAGSTFERSKNRIRSLSEEIRYCNESSLIAMTEMASQVIEQALPLDEEEYAKINPDYHSEIRSTVRELLENVELGNVDDERSLTIMEYIMMKLPSTSDGKYLTEDALTNMFKMQSPVEVESSIRSLSGDVTKRVAALVEKENKKISKVQKDLEEVVPPEENADPSSEEGALPPEGADGANAEIPPEEGQGGDDILGDADSQNQEEGDESFLIDGEGDASGDAAGLDGQPQGGRQIHIGPDGKTNITMPNGQLMMNTDGSMDIQLTEAYIDKVFSDDILNENRVAKLEKKYGADAVVDKELGIKRGHKGPILLSIFGPLWAGMIWSMARDTRNAELDPQADALKRKMMLSPKCKDILDKIKTEINKPKPDKAVLKDLKAQLKTAVSEVRGSNNPAAIKEALVREVPKNGLLESLAVNNAMEMIKEGKEYDPDIAIADAIKTITILEALDEMGLIRVDDEVYGNIITRAGGKYLVENDVASEKIHKAEQENKVLDDQINKNNSTIANAGNKNTKTKLAKENEKLEKRKDKNNETISKLLKKYPNQEIVSKPKSDADKMLDALKNTNVSESTSLSERIRAKREQAEAASLNEAVVVQWKPNTNTIESTDLAERIRRKKMLAEAERAAVQSPTILNG